MLNGPLECSVGMLLVDSQDAKTKILLIMLMLTVLSHLNFVVESCQLVYN